MASNGIQVFFTKEGVDHSPSFSLVNLHGQTQCHDASREIALCKLSQFYCKTGRVRGDRALANGGLGMGSYGDHSEPNFCETQTCLLFCVWAILSSFFLALVFPTSIFDRVWRADLRNSLHARVVGKLASESVYVLPAVRGWAPWVAAGPPRRAVEWSLGDQRLPCWYPTWNQVRIFGASGEFGWRFLSWFL